MLLYKNTFENIKTIGSDFPVEDQFYADRKEAIVADGITRDPVGVFDLASCSFEEMLKKYPRPSGAELAAKEICQNFPKINGTCIRINEDYLEYAYISDCGIIIYDANGNIKFQTEDDKLIYSDPYINKIGIPWHLPESRVIVRRDFRNNPNNIKDGKCVSYGAITGEDEALNFIRYGSKKIENGDLILLYSDGFSNFLHEKDFIDEIKKFDKNSFENFVNNKSTTNYDLYGKEKTIVLYRK